MKRYVLLENKEIVDTTFVNYVTYNIIENRLYRKGGSCLGKIKLQSDNLIDLAEVGDMVEIVDEQGLDYILLTEKWTVCEIMEDFEIKAIWKRNGDVMRRYEM